MTPAISTALPTPEDTKQNSAMVEELKRQNNYEPPAETQKRQATLQLLQNITVEFVKEVSRKRGYPESQVAQFGGRIYPYGSYRLGVFGPGGLLRDCSLY
jgi:poly(A) polymerase